MWQKASFKRALSLGSLLVVLTAAAGRLGQAATVVAGSGIAAGQPASEKGENTWRFSDPTPKDTITWTSGENTADLMHFPMRTFGPEMKFAFPSGGQPAGRDSFDGFSLNQVGPLGSSAITEGEGASATGIEGSVYGTNSHAFWFITADGVLGRAGSAGFGGPHWFSQATGKDPYSLTPEQLSRFTSESHYNLYFAAALVSGSYSPRGSIGLNAYYQTASGTLNLLDISLSAGGGSVTSDNPSGLSFYRLSNIDEGPTEVAANRLTLGQIGDLLTADVSSDNTIDQPLYLVIVLDDLPVPTTDLGDGSVAKYGVGSRAQDAAAIPEPSALLLLGIGALTSLALTRVRSPR
jgi:hypothetical protein